MKKKFKNLKEFWGDKSFDDILLLVKLKEKELKEKELLINENSDYTKGVEKK